MKDQLDHPRSSRVVLASFDKPLRGFAILVKLSIQVSVKLVATFLPIHAEHSLSEDQLVRY